MIKSKFLITIANNFTSTINAQSIYLLMILKTYLPMENFCDLRMI